MRRAKVQKKGPGGEVMGGGGRIKGRRRDYYQGFHCTTNCNGNQFRNDAELSYLKNPVVLQELFEGGHVFRHDRYIIRLLLASPPLHR